MIQLAMGQILHLCNWLQPISMKPDNVDLIEAERINVPLENAIEACCSLLPLHLLVKRKNNPSKHYWQEEKMLLE